MKPTKTLIYIPKSSDINEEIININSLCNIQGVNRFCFTEEQLNEYTANVIKQSLETAANEACTKFIPFTDDEEVNKESITNTFEQIFKQFKV